MWTGMTWVVFGVLVIFVIATVALYIQNDSNKSLKNMYEKDNKDLTKYLNKCKEMIKNMTKVLEEKGYTQMQIWSIKEGTYDERRDNDREDS